MYMATTILDILLLFFRFYYRYGRSNAENMSIEEELWHVFTHYTLMSDPTTPAGLTAQQFLKLAKEVQLVVASKGLAEAQIWYLRKCHRGRSFRVPVGGA